MGQINKSELVDALSDEENLAVKEATSIIDTILKTMSEALARGESVELRGFGTFHVKLYGGYQGRNPKNGEVVAVKPKKLPAFKVGKHLKRAVDEGRSHK